MIALADVVPRADVIWTIDMRRFLAMVVPQGQFLIHGRVYCHDVITQHGMVSVYSVTSIYGSMSFEVIYWKYVS
jgi:hypothetical protein